MRVSLVQYAIPGARAHAMLTFTTAPEKLARYEPTFEAAVQATRGAVEPDASRSETIGTFAGAIVGAAVGARGALYVRRARRRKAAPKPALTSPM